MGKMLIIQLYIRECPYFRICRDIEHSAGKAIDLYISMHEIDSHCVGLLPVMHPNSILRGVGSSLVNLSDVRDKTRYKPGATLL